jgi:hypothetical protein
LEKLKPIQAERYDNISNGLRKIYRRNEFWSLGFFSSTVGIDEEVIKRYVEFQEKMDKGQLQLSLDFKFQCHGRKPVGIYVKYGARTLTT